MQKRDACISVVTFACRSACLAVVRVSAMTVASGYLCRTQRRHHSKCNEPIHALSLPEGSTARTHPALWGHACWYPSAQAHGWACMQCALLILEFSQ